MIQRNGKISHALGLKAYCFLNIAIEKKALQKSKIFVELLNLYFLHILFFTHVSQQLCCIEIQELCVSQKHQCGAEEWSLLGRQ